ncbi:MAG: acylphosphatase [Dehalococcoidales bacterium]|nr:acylphosphatase [Dehalococcoidales bacterium]
MAKLFSVRTIVHGYVQGVFFRSFVEQKSVSLKLTGYVRNWPSGRDVEVLAEGEQDQLEKLIESLKIGPPGSRVDHIRVEWAEAAGKYSDFTIRL